MKMEMLGSVKSLSKVAMMTLTMTVMVTLTVQTPTVPSALQKIVRQLVTKMAMVWQIVLMAVPSLLMHLETLDSVKRWSKVAMTTLTTMEMASLTVWTQTVPPVRQAKTVIPMVTKTVVWQTVPMVVPLR